MNYSSKPYPFPEMIRGHMHFLSLLFVSLAMIFSLPAAHAIEAGMPNPPSKPTLVKCGLFVLDIVDIDDVNETFEAEVAIVATWDDPRLAFDPVEEGTDKKIFQGEFQFNEIFTGWWPQLVIINQIGRGDTNAIKISVLPNGEVTYLEQRNVRLETPMALYDYPFDIQQHSRSIPVLHSCQLFLCSDHQLQEQPLQTCFRMES